MKLMNCNSEEFIKRLDGRKVICFGAGTQLNETVHEVHTIEKLEDHIAFFIDNDTRKHGLKFEYRNREYDIKSVETLKSINVKEYVLLITCAFSVEIYRQLKDVPELAELEFHVNNVVCTYPEMDMERFFTKEIEKRPYKEWRTILEGLRLRNKHKGQRCFIIGNGPSLRLEDMERLKGEVTFAANRIFKLFDRTDWRPTYYFCTDLHVYGLDHKEINKINSEIKFVPIERAIAAGEVYEEITYYNSVIKFTNVKDGKVVKNTEYQFSENIEDIVYDGKTVLYDAIQIAVYMGFSEIYLYGVDFDFKLEVLEDGTIVKHNVAKNHFDDNYEEGYDEVIVVQAPLYALKKAFEKAKEVCEKKGIVIKNATRGGKLEVYERISFDELVD